MMNRTAAYLLGMVWGAIPALTVFLCLGPWRRRRLRERGLESPRLRETVLALFWMFCGGMAVLTLTPRWWSGLWWTFSMGIAGMWETILFLNGARLI